ncbi:MAG: hypothetical protein RR827_09445, partial [Oscillospiraceae bacterium]
MNINKTINLVIQDFIWYLSKYTIGSVIVCCDNLDADGWVWLFHQFENAQIVLVDKDYLHYRF